MIEILRPEQQQAFDLVKDGHSICLTGPGGTGKSFIIKYIISSLGSDRRIAVTALTGIAGTLINGVTLHSWAGIPVKQVNKEKLVAQIRSDEEALSEWKDTDLLIIDEVSMMSAELFNKLDYLGRELRDSSDKPMGGLQLVLSGDFCQLPPIGNNERYCFESTIWSQAIKKTFSLTEILRQADPQLQAVLNEIRTGNVSTTTKEILSQRIIENLSPEQQEQLMSRETVRPTVVYPHKDRVNEINQRELNNLINEGAPSFSYKYADSHSIKGWVKGKAKNLSAKELADYLDQSCTAEKNLVLTIGSQVMLLVNLDVEHGLVNGLTGLVTGFDTDNNPLVTFYNGIHKKIIPYTWSPDHPKYILKRVQIPLILAWAITVHRSQGATLPCVLADLREAFGSGMAYVILSRIKSLDGLYLEGINYSKIKCDPRVRDFYRGITKNLT